MKLWSHSAHILCQNKDIIKVIFIMITYLVCYFTYNDIIFCLIFYLRVKLCEESQLTALASNQMRAGAGRRTERQDKS